MPQTETRRDAHRARERRAMTTPRAMTTTGASVRARRWVATRGERARGVGDSKTRARTTTRAVDQSLNPRVAALRPSKTVALTDLARTMKESGADVIGLAAGEPDFATPPRVAAAGKAAIDAGKTKYSPNAGDAKLREAIADKLEKENGLKYDALSEIVLSNGAKQSVAQCVLATCGRADEVIVRRRTG